MGCQLSRRRPSTSGLAQDVPDFIEETVGPVGSKVQVEVLRLTFKGQKKTSLRLLDVMTRQRMEDVVFAPGPRRAQFFGEPEDGLDE